VSAPDIRYPAADRPFRTPDEALVACREELAMARFIATRPHTHLLRIVAATGECEALTITPAMACMMFEQGEFTASQFATQWDDVMLSALIERLDGAGQDRHEPLAMMDWAHVEQAERPTDSGNRTSTGHRILGNQKVMSAEFPFNSGTVLTRPEYEKAVAQRRSDSAEVLAKTLAEASAVLEVAGRVLGASPDATQLAAACRRQAERSGAILSDALGMTPAVLKTQPALVEHQARQAAASLGRIGRGV